jgi:regulator of protease activity HflC (stomatin/prohibitin superfamily)
VSISIFIGLLLIALAAVIIWSIIIVVPQQSAFVVERAGRYDRTLTAGYHFLLPFLDVIRYKHSLKEVAKDIPEQICITKDNVQVAVDGVLYLSIMNPHDASYGIDDYDFAITQLAQTTLRSEIGKIELDKTFEERTNINQEVVSELDKATESWGVKVKRYEIKNITPPHDVLAAMEKQMRAEREKRATILASEAERDAAINVAEGKKQQVIKASEATREREINEAAGQADAILALADATAAGVKRIAEAVSNPGGIEALQFRIAEQYIEQFGNLAKQSTSLVLPANVSDLGSMITLASQIIHPTDMAGGLTPRRAANLNKRETLDIRSSQSVEDG